jgi:hypothetical protein
MLQNHWEMKTILQGRGKGENGLKFAAVFLIDLTSPSLFA